MSTLALGGWKKAFLGMGIAVGALIGAADLFFPEQSRPDFADADPTGIKYTGAGSCAAAACHGSAQPKDDGTTRHNENIHWAEKDKHAKAYATLTSKDSQEMAQKLKLDATKSGRCVNCHALSGLSVGDSVARILLAPNDIDAAGKYSIEDGVSCDACHGPAAKYTKPHEKKGWTKEQFAALGSMKLYDEWGLFYTKDLKMRANTCISCHLKIDHDLLEAGHPELPFELNLYSTGEWVHWKDKDKWYGGKAFAMGQAISLREAAEQLADRIAKKADPKLITKGYNQIIAHGIMSRQVAQLLDAESLKSLNEQLTAVNKDWADGAKTAPALKALAKAAGGLADKINVKTFDQATVEGLIKGVASEIEIGKFGFRAAEQYALALGSLWAVITVDAAPADAEAKQEKIEGLYEAMGESPEEYSAAKYAEATKSMAALFPGGNTIPLPAGGPTP